VYFCASVDSVVRQLSELSRTRRHVLVLWTVRNSIAQRETLVETLHYEVSDGKLFIIIIVRLFASRGRKFNMK